MRPQFICFGSGKPEDEIHINSHSLKEGLQPWYYNEAKHFIHDAAKQSLDFCQFEGDREGERMKKKNIIKKCTWYLMLFFKLFIMGRSNICFLLHGVEISPLRGWEKRIIGKFSMLTPSCS